MKLLRAFLSRLNAPLIGECRDRDLALELDAHLEMLTDDNLRAGLAPEEARRRARIALGGLESVKEDCRDRWDFPFLSSFWRDLRYAARTLGRNRTFAATAILTLALGIGANTAIFSLLNAVLLRNLPVRQPQQLVFFGKAHNAGSNDVLPTGDVQLFSYPFYREFRRENRVFSDVAAICSIPFAAHGRVAPNTDLEKINVELVSGSYFNTLGVNSILGRALSDADDQTPGAHPVAVASYSWWQSRLAKDRSAVGSTVKIASTVYTIVGVAPREFFGVTVGQSPDLWIPLAMEKEISPGWNGREKNLFQSLHLIARRKPGVNEAQAGTETNLLFRRILLSYAGPKPTRRQLDDIRHARIDLTPAATGRSYLRTQFSAPLEILMGLVALVLLIACANVANLQLGRATARQREMAVRMSMGAGRSRLIRQLIIESGLLGSAGAMLGLLLAWGASRLLLLMVSTGGDSLPVRVTPDAAALGFTLAITALTVLLFGMAPAFRITGLDLAAALKTGRGIVSVGNRLTRGLVAGQVAMSLILLVCAGLFLRSLTNLMDVDTGFDKQNVLLMGVDPGAAGYQVDSRLESMMQRVEERVGSLPGIQSAGFAMSVFEGGGMTVGITVPGRPSGAGETEVFHDIVGPRYLDAMKMPIVMGRGLSVRDNGASPRVAVINETMAHTYFPGGSPLGRTFGVGDELGNDPSWQNIEVVGVVKDAKYMRLQEKPQPAAFYPHAQHSLHLLFNFVARYRGNPGAIAAEIRSGVREIDPNLPIGDFRSLERVVDDSVLNKRVAAQLATFFGLLAAFLACIGIYGVMSWGIARRTGEFGMRMALGAGRRGVLWIVLKEILWLIFAGIAAGLALALASSRLVGSLLYGLNSYDPAVIGLSILAMSAAALLAGYLPARRATRIDPMAALRYE
jgi:predicted permease